MLSTFRNTAAALGGASVKPASYLVALAVSLFAAGSAQSAPLVANGSFETPVVTAGSFTTFSVGSSLLTGWTVFGPLNTNVAIVSGTFAQSGVTFEAQDGAQWLDLTGNNSNSIEGVSQVVSTVSGHRYQLSYFIGNTTGGGVFGTTSTVGVAAGLNIFTHTNSNADSTGLNWEQFTDTFTATASSTLIAFQNLDPSTDNSNGLDNIVLTDLGPAISAPEPVSLTLLAVGLAGLGMAQRLRARKGRIATTG